MVDFSWQAQFAVQIYSLLPPIYAGMDGAFVGKDTSSLPNFLDIWELKGENKKLVTLFVLEVNESYKELAQKDREKERRKSKAKRK